MPDLNDAQFGLFSAHDQSMRKRTAAEMSTEQFRTLPGAYHHATYRATMPTKSTGMGSAGIHLGTRQAAMERVDDMGARNPNMSDIHADPSKPADIHVRRISPGANMATTVDNPDQDRGEDWDGMGEREAHEFGEHYKNTHEDEGSISIRVPDASYLDSHRKAVDRATRSGEPVHPEAVAARAGGHLDKPEQYTAGSRVDAATPYSRYRERQASEPSASDNREQGMLLPYKVQATGRTNAHKMETVPNPHADTPNQNPTLRVPSVTFAATQGDVDALTSQKYKTVMNERNPIWESKTGKF